MEAKMMIQKMGNEIGINIPQVIAKGFSLREGIYVSVYDSCNRIIIEPDKSVISYNLTDMLNEITEDNIHKSIETETATENEYLIDLAESRLDEEAIPLDEIFRKYNFCDVKFELYS